MTYQVTEGISESDLSSWLKDALKNHGTFKDGRVDYTHAEIAPVIICTVVYKDEILLVKRGHGLADANGYWSVVTGFIDENIPITEIAQKELEEELGLKVDAKEIKSGNSYTLDNTDEQRKYIIFPCLVVLDSKPKIKLDKEHTDYTWIKRSDLENYHILDDLPHAIDEALRLR